MPRMLGAASIRSTISTIEAVQRKIVLEITWLGSIFTTILNTKVSIIERVAAAQATIAELEASSLNPESPSRKIQDIVSAARDGNVADVEAAAGQSKLSNWVLTEDQITNALKTPLSQNSPSNAGPAAHNSSPAKNTQSNLMNSGDGAGTAPGSDRKANLTQPQCSASAGERDSSQLRAGAHPSSPAAQDDPWYVELPFCIECSRERTASVPHLGQPQGSSSGTPSLGSSGGGSSSGGVCPVEPPAAAPKPPQPRPAAARVLVPRQSIRPSRTSKRVSAISPRPPARRSPR
ncbi:hypothetical protein FBY28_4551 [Arthrobacter sp. SLBN-53]|nr:hypothetical protein FBY28_4551 [Arthrobacter sp. SLBN-53]